MIDRILNVLSDNPEGLAPRQLQAALGLASPGELTDDLGTLIGDGRVEHADVGGVSVYRKGVVKPEAPKAKAAPTSRMVPLVHLDNIATALGLEPGTPMATIVAQVQVLAEMRRAAGEIVRWETHDAVTWIAFPHPSAPSSGYIPPAPWVASYAYDDGKSYAKVSASGKRWDWAVDDGGTGDAATLEKAIRIADAVRALS